MALRLCPIATARPAHAVAQNVAAEWAMDRCCQTRRQRRLLPALYRRSCVERRSSVLLEGDDGPQGFFSAACDAQDKGPSTHQRMVHYRQQASPLAVRAATGALDASGLGPTRVTHLVTVSCTGFDAPGVDLAILKQLGLRPTVERTHVGFMGCHGALNGLRAASAFIGANPASVVLLCAVELCSLHFHYGWDPQRIVANALFADGAAAVVAVNESAIGDSDRWRLVANGSCVLPDSEDAMTWRIGDHGFEMTLSTQVPDLVRHHLRPWLQRWLAEYGLAIGAIGSWAVHPGGPRVVSAVAGALTVPDTLFDTSRDVLAACGNMSSPTLLFILDRLQRQRAPRPCVALGFGPGLTIEAAVLD